MQPKGRCKQGFLRRRFHKKSRDALDTYKSFGKVIVNPGRRRDWTPCNPQTLGYTEKQFVLRGELCTPFHLLLKLLCIPFPMQKGLALRSLSSRWIAAHCLRQDWRFGFGCNLCRCSV